MSCSISISDVTEDTWMLRNAMFRWFAKQFADAFRDDAELVHRIEMAVAFNGVSLDLLYEENPTLAVRFRDSLRVISSKIATGELVICDDTDPVPDQESAKEAFGELVQLLDRAHFDHT